MLRRRQDYYCSPNVMVPVTIVLVLSALVPTTMALSSRDVPGGLEPEQFGVLFKRPMSTNSKPRSENPQASSVMSRGVSAASGQPLSSGNLAQSSAQSHPKGPIGGPISHIPPRQPVSQRSSQPHRVQSKQGLPPPLSSAAQIPSIYKEAGLPTYELAKPKIHEPMKPHLFQFEPWQQTEPCKSSMIASYFYRSMLFYSRHFIVVSL